MVEKANPWLRSCGAKTNVRQAAKQSGPPFGRTMGAAPEPDGDLEPKWLRRVWCGVAWCLGSDPFSSAFYARRDAAVKTAYAGRA